MCLFALMINVREKRQIINILTCLFALMINVREKRKMSNEIEIICYECQSNKNPNPITFCEVLKAVYRRAKRDKIQN